MRVSVERFPYTVNPTFHELFRGINARIVAIRGGTMASKSFSVGQYVAYTASIIPGYRWLVTRKFASQVRGTVFEQLCDILRRWNLMGLWRATIAPLELRNRLNGNRIIFSGLDDPEKLKSLPGLTHWWAEEPSEMSEEDFNMTLMRIRHPGPPGTRNQSLLTFNPISATHWLKQRFFDRPDPAVHTMHVTYRDNRFLTADQDALIDYYRRQGQYYETVYVEGEWGVMGDAVFTDYEFRPVSYGWGDLENLTGGMDFGTVHPQAIEILGYRDTIQYSVDEVWGRWPTNADFIGAASDYWERRGMLEQVKRLPIVADSAEPDRITEWRRAGWNVRAAKKGPGTLRFGIDHLARHHWVVDSDRCPGLIKELPGFQRRKDKDGNATEGFVEINDDGIAACRYATEHLWAVGRPRVRVEGRIV